MQESKPLIRRLSAPGSLSAVLAVVYFSLRGYQSAWLGAREQAYLLAALAACIGIVAVRLLSYLLLDLLFLRRKGREAPQILRMVVSIVGYTAIFVVIYSGVFDKSLSGILATSAVLTVILGLALQDTLGNFFAGISLHIEQPYHIGDSLRVADVVGKVESVTWRTTAVRTNGNSVVVLPNSRIAREPIEVFSLNSLNRRALRFPAPYSVPPETIISMARQIAGSVPKVSAKIEPVARIAEFSDSSITYELLYWITDYMWAQDIESVFREHLWYAFGRAGIDIPFPTRQVLVEKRASATTEPLPDYGTFLAGVDILKPLNAGELEEVARAMRRHLYAPGEIVLRTGDPGGSMFILERGQAEVLALDPAGKLCQVAMLKQGDVIGEMGLFTGEPRRANVRATEELALLEIGKPVMREILTRNTLLAEAFSRIIASRQAQLTRLSEAVAGDEKISEGDTILRRIKRFFSLS